MSDPAREAAQRALVATRGHGNSTLCEIESAREALAPIRELHKPVVEMRTSPRNSRAEYSVTVCDECQYEWPCETAPLVYSSAELGGVAGD